MDIKKYFDDKPIKVRYQKVVAKETASALKKFALRSRSSFKLWNSREKLFSSALMKL